MKLWFKLFVFPWLAGIFGKFLLTQISDVVVPTVFESYIGVNSPELTAFVQSGAAVRSPLLDQFAVEGGRLVHIPFWKDLDPTIEPNYSTDDPNTSATPQKLIADQMQSRIANMNQAWSAADLAQEIAGSDPMQRIADRTSTYWARNFQTRCIAIAVGMFNANVAGNVDASGAASDMVNDISINDGALVQVTNLFSRQAFTGSVFTLGDHFDQITTIAVHSAVYRRMVDNDDITFVKASEPDPNLPLGSQGTPYFQGKRVVVDDQCPVIATGVNGGLRFVSIMFGQAFLGFGEGEARVPVEVFRIPGQGNGGGVEQLWNRKTWIIHPFGHNWTDNTVTAPGFSATLADLKLAANWARKIQRKLVPLSFLVTNG